MNINHKGELKTGAKIFIALLIAIAILATFFTLSKDTTSHELATCGATICEQFNQEYRGWAQDTLQCTYNYDRFGYPEVDEIFTFKVNQSMIDRLCPAGATNGNQTR